MRKLSIVLITITALVLVGPVLAAKPDPKVIRHCGCVLDEYGVDGVGMVYHDVEVAGKSGGHKRHVVPSYDDCPTGEFVDLEEITEEWIRTGADCLVSGTDADISDCPSVEPFIEVGDDCGDLIIEP